MLKVCRKIISNTDETELDSKADKILKKTLTNLDKFYIFWTYFI